MKRQKIKRGARLLELRPQKENGEPYTDIEWAKEIGLSNTRFHNFIKDYGEKKEVAIDLVGVWITNKYGPDIAIRWWLGIDPMLPEELSGPPKNASETKGFKRNFGARIIDNLGALSKSGLWRVYGVLITCGLFTDIFYILTHRW